MNNGASFLVGVLAGFFIFTETGKNIANSMANIAVNQAMPGATMLMNAATKAMKPTTPTPTSTPVEDAINPTPATSARQEVMK